MLRALLKACRCVEKRVFHTCVPAVHVVVTLNSRPWAFVNVI